MAYQRKILVKCITLQSGEQVHVTIPLTFCMQIYMYTKFTMYIESVMASDSESRGPGFIPHKRHSVVSLSKTPYSND